MLQQTSAKAWAGAIVSAVLAVAATTFGWQVGPEIESWLQAGIVFVISGALAMGSNWLAIYNVSNAPEGGKVVVIPDTPEKPN